MSPKLHTIKFTGVSFRLPSLVILALIEAEIAGRGRICPPFPGRVILRPFPVRVLRCTCARARCTPPSYVVHHRITLMELYRCTNFHVAYSKYLKVSQRARALHVHNAPLEVRGRAKCTTRSQVMYQRIILVKLFQCTKFRVASSKFPKSKGAYAYA